MVMISYRKRNAAQLLYNAKIVIHLLFLKYGEVLCFHFKGIDGLVCFKLMHYKKHVIPFTELNRVNAFV